MYTIIPLTPPHNLHSEFTMAEIEHFVDPLNKDHARFDEIKDVVLNLLPASVQQAGKTEVVPTPIGEAVAKVSL